MLDCIVLICRTKNLLWKWHLHCQFFISISAFSQLFRSTIFLRKITRKISRVLKIQRLQIWQHFESLVLAEVEAEKIKRLCLSLLVENYHSHSSSDNLNWAIWQSGHDIDKEVGRVIPFKGVEFGAIWVNLVILLVSAWLCIVLLYFEK